MTTAFKLPSATIIYPNWRFNSQYYPQLPISVTAAPATTIVFRKTLSSLGTGGGKRQTHNS